jgi:hypothetical protein
VKALNPDHEVTRVIPHSRRTIATFVTDSAVIFMFVARALIARLLGQSASAYAR